MGYMLAYSNAWIRGNENLCFLCNHVSGQKKRENYGVER